jgi:hypothetical protein
MEAKRKGRPPGQMTRRRQQVLAHVQRLIEGGEALSPSGISRAVGLAHHSAAIRIVKDLRRMGKLPPGT